MLRHRPSRQPIGQLTAQATSGAANSFQSGNVHFKVNAVPRNIAGATRNHKSMPGLPATTRSSTQFANPVHDRRNTSFLPTVGHAHHFRDRASSDITPAGQVTQTGSGTTMTAQVCQLRPFAQKRFKPTVLATRSTFHMVKISRRCQISTKIGWATSATSPPAANTFDKGISLPFPAKNSLHNTGNSHATKNCPSSASQAACHCGNHHHVDILDTQHELNTVHGTHFRRPQC